MGIEAQSTDEQVIYTTRHMCMDVRGAIRNFKRGEWLRVVSRDDGTYLTPNEVKEWLMDELSKGHRVVPLGKICAGFSYETGCPGHRSEARE